MIINFHSPFVKGKYSFIMVIIIIIVVIILFGLVLICQELNELVFLIKHQYRVLIQI